MRHVDIWERALRPEGTICAKVLSWECVGMSGEQKGDGWAEEGLASSINWGLIGK